MARDPAFHTITRLPSAERNQAALRGPEDALSAPVNDDLITSALSMWPTGPAWGAPDGQALSITSRLALFTRVLLDGWVWLYARAFSLAREATVQGASELLPEWELDHGLPEECFASTERTTAERLKDLARKVMAEGVNHPTDFVRLASDYGFEIEIEEPDIFGCGFSECGGFHEVGFYTEETYWIVRVQNVSVSYFEAGAGETGYDPLFSFGAAEQLLCLVRKLAPAWTIPVLQPWTQRTVLSDGGTYGLCDEYGNPLFFIIPE